MRTLVPTALFALLCGALLSTSASSQEPGPLPPAKRTGTMSIEEAMARRASVRALRSQPLSQEHIAQLLWATQGTSRPGRRTAPSAGALYPLELYLVTREGIARYDPARHTLVPHRTGDRRAALYTAALAQDPLREAPAIFVIAGVYARTQRKYGSRAPRYVYMEVGHAGQNLLLQATALGLGAVPMGAFDDARVKRTLELPRAHEPLYLIPVGWPR